MSDAGTGGRRLAAASAGNALELRGVTKTFGALVALADVTMSVRPGERRAVLGSNGAGKTTLFNCIAGAFAPTAGRVAFDGRQIAGLDPARIARLGLARTYQNLRVFPDITVFDNVSVGAMGRLGISLWDALLPGIGARRSEAIADSTVQALSAFDLLPYADQPAGNLSYGQKKNLEMARALSLHPKLLMLDEPAAGLNNTETAELAQRIVALRERGLTIVLVEHDMSIVMRICERIIVLDSGRLIGDGTPAQIRQDPQVRSAYLGDDE